jgi:hypothetical protein
MHVLIKIHHHKEISALTYGVLSVKNMQREWLVKLVIHLGLFPDLPFQGLLLFIQIIHSQCNYFCSPQFLGLVLLTIAMQSLWRGRLMANGRTIAPATCLQCPISQM